MKTPPSLTHTRAHPHTHTHTHTLLRILDQKLRELVVMMGPDDNSTCTSEEWTKHVHPQREHMHSTKAMSITRKKMISVPLATYLKPVCGSCTTYCSNVWLYSCCGFVHFLFPFYLCRVTLPLYQSFLSLLSVSIESVHNGVTTQSYGYCAYSTDVYTT